MYALVTLLLVVLIGAGGGYWAIKKIRTKQNQEVRCEAKLTLKEEGANPADLKEAFLSDMAIDHAIKEYDLVTRWELADGDAAKGRIRQKFTVKIDGLEVILGYQDKDKHLAQEVLTSLMNSFSEQRNINLNGAGSN